MKIYLWSQKPHQASLALESLRNEVFFQFSNIIINFSKKIKVNAHIVTIGSSKHIKKYKSKNLDDSEKAAVRCCAEGENKCFSKFTNDKGREKCFGRGKTF